MDFPRPARFDARLFVAVADAERVERRQHAVGEDDDVHLRAREDGAPQVVHPPDPRQLVGRVRLDVVVSVTGCVRWGLKIK